MQVGKTLLLALCQMSLSWGLPAGLSDRVSALVFPNNKKKTKKKKNASRNTHIPRKKQNKQNTKSKRQREAAEVCTLVLCCCQSSCYLPASGSLEKSKRKILIIREFQLPTNNFLNFYRAQDSWTACLLAILHMPNFILCVLQFSSNGSGLFTCYSVFSLREAAWPLSGFAFVPLWGGGVQCTRILFCNSNKRREVEFLHLWLRIWS